MTLRKTCLLILAICFSLQAYSQKNFKVTMRNDSVFNNNVLQFVVTKKSSLDKQLIQLRAPDSSVQAFLIVVLQDDKLRFSGRFVKLDKIYDCLYPKMEMLTLYESYIRSGVFVNGVADLKGLDAYCKERKIEMRSIEKRKVAKPSERDSILKLNAEERMKNMVQIEISNTSANAMTIMAGTQGGMVNGKRVYREKRQDIIPAGERRMFTAFIGELICIVAGAEERDCRQVDHSMRQLTILEKGEGFKN